MPLNKKGRKILKEMRAKYGNRKGESVFYASINSGKIKGVEEKAKKDQKKKKK
jgi:CRISPR/Cas system-associated endoribonuclease Cas2